MHKRARTKPRVLQHALADSAAGTLTAYWQAICGHL